MITKNQIRREVYNTSSSLTDYQLFSSLAYQELLQATVSSICNQFNRVPIVRTVCEPDSLITAYTDSMYITTNTLSLFETSMDTRAKKDLVNTSKVSHEAFHCLFTCFNWLNPLRKNWLQGSTVFYPSVPKVKGAEDLKNYLISHPQVRAIYGQLMCDVCNVLEDGYIENRGYELFSGSMMSGFPLMCEVLHSKTPTNKQILDKIVKGELFPVHLAVFKIQGIRCGLGMKTEAGLTSQQQKIELAVDAVLANCSEEINKLLYERNGKKRAELFNILFVKLFALMPLQNEQINQNQQGNTQGQSDSKGTGNANNNNESNCKDNSKQQPEDSKNDEVKGSSNASYSENKSDNSSANSNNSKKNWGEDEDLSSRLKNNQNDYNNEITDRITNNAKQLSDESEITEKTEGNTASVDEKGQAQNDLVEQKKQLAKSVTENKKSMEAIEKKLTNSIAESITRAELSEEVMQKNIDTAKQIFIKSITSVTAFRGYKLAIKDKDKGLYDRICKSKDIVRKATNLARRINDVLSRREEGYEDGYLYGSKFNPTTVVHNDGRYFSRRLEPDGQPSVAFSIIIDESGSMSWGCKYVSARDTAILLDAVMTMLDIPYSIIGHTTGSSGTVLINQYVDYDRICDDECYRLANIGADGGNIDGAVITFEAERLLQRSEAEKVMIVISDGLPAGYSFYSSSGEEDTMGAIKKYRRKGIKIFGAIIDDYENIVKLYDERFAFDCRKPAVLEKSLVRLIERYILTEH